MHQTLFAYATRSFFCPFPNQLCITLASQIWAGQKKKEKKRTNNRKKTTTFCCILAGEANSSKCSLIRYSQKKKAPLVPPEQPNFQQSGGTRCCTRYSQLGATGNSDRRQVFSSASPDDMADFVCLSLARRQTAAWAGSWPTGMVQVAPTEAQLAGCSSDQYRKCPTVLIYL